ncbi:M20/M25/M40 family metallo-hydrolase [bacterium]|nr:M20/M25/M40 family metallo-hydrolase [bacterium]
MKTKQLLRYMVTAALLAVLVLPLAAQTTNIRVDGQRIYDLIDHMAADRYLGRKPLTPEFRELQDWAAKNFETWGLEPAGENGTYFQSVPVEGRGRSMNFTMVSGIPELKIGGREFFQRYGDFSIDQRSVTGKKMKGEIVFAGYGISAPGKGLDEYAGIDVKGKFVFVLKGSPADVEAPRDRFAPEQAEAAADEGAEWKEEIEDSTKINVAYAKGAAGIIFFNPASASDDPFARFRRGRAPLEKSPFTRDFMIVSEVSDRVLKWMFYTDDQESDRAFERRMNAIQLDIKNGTSRSFATGIKAEIKGFDKVEYYGKDFGGDIGRNVIARITGSDPVLKNEYVIIGGHYDHLGVTNGQVYNGADDNASGSAVTMEIARVMKANGIQPKRTVIFCLWTAEELGLIGSNYYAANPSDGVAMDNVVAYFNMDMVGMGDRIDAPGALNFPELWDIIKKDQLPEVIGIVDPATGTPGGSDYSAFISRGIEALGLMTSGGGGHPDYHDTGDDIVHIEPDILGKTGQFVLQGTINLANAPGSLIVPERQDIYNALSWNITLINPALNAERGWTQLEPKTRDDLAKAIADKISELQQPAGTGQDNTMMRYLRRFGGGRGSINQGLAGPGVYGNDPVLLKIAKDALQFGRLDVCGRDSIWFDAGLTECGARGLKAVQDLDILVTVNAPTAAALDAMLAAAEKPFIVQGEVTLSDEQIAVMNEKKTLLAVDFAPAEVSDCVSNLVTLKERFGDTDNLLLRVMSSENLDEAKRVLYMALIDKGWSHEEIYAIGGAGANRGSAGNLDAVQPPRNIRRFGM